MQRPTSSRVLPGRLRDVFPPADAETSKLLCVAVLFEDLRIEISGLRLGRTDDVLADGSHELRYLYFLRRSVATLYEFQEALYTAGRTDTFGRLRLSADEARQWDRAVRFFRRRTKFLNHLRNDVGGHFGVKATERAIRTLDDKEVGFMEAAWLAGGESGFKLKFAAQIAATCLIDHCRGASADERLRWFFRFMNAAYAHAIRATNILAMNYFWPRFERGQ